MAGAATVEKALDVLFHLHAAPGALALGEIARALGLAKSSCHRLLASLVERDVVEQDESGRYRPGLALLSLGLGAQRREPVVRIAREYIEAEAAELGETVFLVAERRGQLRVLDKCEGNGFLRAAPDVGDVIPPDVTATGKLYRAYRPGPGGADRTAPGGAVQTESRETAADAATRDEVVRRGYAVNRDAWIDGLSVLGVPIGQGDLERGAPLVAVLALAAASTRFDKLGEEAIAARLIAAAAKIGERLGTGADQGRAADRRGPAPRPRQRKKDQEWTG